jgi:hypothetical protein
MNILILYILTSCRPLIGILLGLILVASFFYLHLYQKKNIVGWVAKYIFRNQYRSVKSAEGLFNAVVSFIFAIGGIWIILAVYYLTNR